MLLVSRYIQKMPKTTNSEAFFRGVTAYVRKHYKKSMMPRLAAHPEDRLTCSAVVKRLLATGMTQEELLQNDIARPTIIPRMLETMQQQNITYSVIDGFPIDRLHVRIIPLDFRPWEIVLASDGYPVLCPTLQESEEMLSKQREKDPLNIGEFQATKAFHPDFNSFDDRSYVRLKV